MEAYQDTNKHVNLFKALLENRSYKNHFLNRHADLLNTIFLPETFSQEVDITIAEIDVEMQRYFVEWGWPTHDIWINERVPRIYDYIEERPHYARNFLRQYFGLPNEVNLSLQTFPAGAGTIQINTITPDLPWEGIYFNGVPVTLTIQPNPGYVFSHWASRHTIDQQDASTSISYNFETDDEIVAYFEHEEPLLTMTAVNPVQEKTLQLFISLANVEALSFQLMDIQGKIIANWPSASYGIGGQAITFSLPTALPSGTYLLQANGDSLVETIKVIVMD